MWTVYGLVDPRNMTMFYVGCSRSMERRMKRHKYGDHDSASYFIAKEIRYIGLEFGVVVLATSESKVEAINIERKIILALDNLANVQKRPADFMVVSEFQSQNNQHQ